MMRSMFAGVFGLRSHHTMMDVVGHNIANVIMTASDEPLGDLVNLKR